VALGEKARRTHETPHLTRATAIFKTCVRLAFSPEASPNRTRRSKQSVFCQPYNMFCGHSLPYQLMYLNVVTMDQDDDLKTLLKGPTPGPPPV
jgi:hypothetical protein